MCDACRKQDGKIKKLFSEYSGRRYKLSWSENGTGSGGSRILVEEEISANVVKLEEKAIALTT